MLRECPIHDGDPQAVAIGGREGATAKNGKAEGMEVVWCYAGDRNLRPATQRGFGLSLKTDASKGMSAYERQARRDRSGINASNGANFIEDLSEKGRPLLRLWIWILGQNRQRDLHREHAVGTKTRTLICQPDKRANQQRRADQQNHGRRDLRHYQDAMHTLLASAKASRRRRLIRHRGLDGAHGPTGRLGACDGQARMAELSDQPDRFDKLLAAHPGK